MYRCNPICDLSTCYNICDDAMMRFEDCTVMWAYCVIGSELSSILCELRCFDAEVCWFNGPSCYAFDKVFGETALWVFSRFLIDLCSASFFVVCAIFGLPGCFGWKPVSWYYDKQLIWLNRMQSRRTSFSWNYPSLHSSSLNVMGAQLTKFEFFC